MISRRGTRRSGAASGVAKIFRDEGRGPVVTAGRVVSGLERMFILYPPLYCCHSGRSEGPIRNLDVVARDSGFALRAPRNDAGGSFVNHHAASALWPSHCRTLASGSAFWVMSLTTPMESAPAA